MAGQPHTHVCRHPRRAAKQAEAKQRNADHATLTTAQKIAKARGRRGDSAREINRLVT